jgi:hypothetical protein
VALSSTAEYPAWPEQPPSGWSWPAFALGAFWFLRHGLNDRGRFLLVPQIIVIALACLNGLFVIRQESLGDQATIAAGLLPALAGALALWSLFGSYCAATFRGEAYRQWCVENGQTPLVPTQWHWGAFLLTGGWYIINGMRVKGLWLSLAFFTSVGSIVGIPIAFAIMCYCGGNSRAEQYLENPPADIGPTPQEHWIHQDILKSLTAVAKTPQASLRASLMESAVRGLNRQGYTVNISDDEDESASALTLERGNRFVAVRTVPDAPVALEQVEQLEAELQANARRVGVLVVNGPLTEQAQTAARQAHVRVLNVQDEVT